MRWNKVLSRSGVVKAVALATPKVNRPKAISEQACGREASRFKKENERKNYCTSIVHGCGCGWMGSLVWVAGKSALASFILKSNTSVRCDTVKCVYQCALSQRNANIYLNFLVHTQHILKAGVPVLCLFLLFLLLHYFTKFLHFLRLGILRFAMHSFAKFTDCSTQLSKYLRIIYKNHRRFDLVSFSNFVCYSITSFQGGVYLVNFLNVYGPGLAILFVVFIEAAGVFWFYGVDNFSTDVESMLGQRPGIFWRVCWMYISPVCPQLEEEEYRRELIISFISGLVFSRFRYFYWWYLSFHCLDMKRCLAKNTRIPIGALCLAGFLRCHQ